MVRPVTTRCLSYYPRITTVQREYYNFGSTDAQVVGYRPGGFSNPDLGWEKNKQVDVGLDVGPIKKPDRPGHRLL